MQLVGSAASVIGTRAPGTPRGDRHLSEPERYPGLSTDRYTIRRVRQWCRRHVAVFAVVFAAVALVLVGVVVVQAAMLHARGWRVAWGTMPDWFAGVGGLATIAALIVAWLVYRNDVKTRADDERQRAAIERRRQAGLLTAWFVDHGSARLGSAIVDGSRPGPVPGDAPRPIINVAEVGLINASQVVVYDLIVAAVCEPHSPLPIAYSPTDIRLTERVEWNQERDRLARGRARVLPPGQWSVALRLATASLVPTAVHLFFRDHQGVYGGATPRAS